MSSRLLQILKNIERDYELNKSFYDNLLNHLREIHEQNPRPAQPEGLWEHHKYKSGLKIHSENISKLLTIALENYVPSQMINDAHRILFQLYGYAHDIAKAALDYDEIDHAEKSHEWLINYLKDKFGISERRAEEMELLKVLLIMVKHHHLNFADPQCFAKRAECLNLTDYFPFILIAASADMLDIGISWIGDVL